MVSLPSNAVVAFPAETPSTIEKKFVLALQLEASRRTKKDVDVIYAFLHGMEALACLREPALRTICKTVRYESHTANHILYSRGARATCWYILLAGSVFIDGSMFLPRNSFGKRPSGCACRSNECLVLEPSDMIVIDYPDATLMSSSAARALSRKHAFRLRDDDTEDDHDLRDKVTGSESTGDGRRGDDKADDHTKLPAALQCVASILQDSESRLLRRSVSGRGGPPGGAPCRTSSCDRSSVNSDTLASSLASSLTPSDDVNSLVESLVDSDDDYNDSTESLIVRDTVRDCLEKDPAERTDDDIDVLFEFMQHLPAFANMTVATRRALCAVMVFAVVDRAGTVVMKAGEELDSWSVILNGHVEVELPNGTIEHLHMGDSFGITPTMERMYHKGTMRTKIDDCQFVCITQADYYSILHQGEENTQRHKEGDALVLVTEHRFLDNGNRKGYIVIRGTCERLLGHIVSPHSSVDPTFIEDFLLTYRTFLDHPRRITDQLLKWFDDPAQRDKVTRVVLLWVNNHFNDFETEPQMSEFLLQFEQLLEKQRMKGQLWLLNMACAANARLRHVVLTRATRHEILPFSVLGGLERGCGIFVSKVEERCGGGGGGGAKAAAEAGLTRGDQIMEVNNHSFEQISHNRALEILRGTTHLSITVKSNLLAFREMLEAQDNWTNHRRHGNKCRSGQLDVNGSASHAPLQGYLEKLGRRALARISLLPRNGNSETNLSQLEDSYLRLSSAATRQTSVSSVSSADAAPRRTPYLSSSNPDLTTSTTTAVTAATSQYDELLASRSHVPEHVLKVYRADQTCKYFLVNRETTAREVVMLVLKEFGITDPSSNYSLCEVSVEVEGLIKQKRLPDQMTNLPDRISLNSRYYVKNKLSTEALVPDELSQELLREQTSSLLHLDCAEVAAQLTLRDFLLFSEIEPTEYIDDLFDRESAYGTPRLHKFSQFVNEEMFWVVSEVCSETNIMKRMKLIKNFIKIARYCKDCKNFNSMFAIVSGLGHGSVSRLRNTWDKLPSKYVKMFTDLQDLMDPSRNMSKYRNLLNNELIQPPLIPFFPVVKKDLTFIHLGNDSKVDGLINFEKLRMIAKEVRRVCDMAATQSEIQNAHSNFCGAQNVFMAFSGVDTMAAMATLRRKRRASTVPNPRKMFEEAHVVRRVRAYLSTVVIIDNEAKLNELSILCEPAVPRRRDVSTSSLSSGGADDRGRYVHLGPKFGAESPDAVRKLMSLTDKVRPHNPKQHGAPQGGAGRPPSGGGRAGPLSPRQSRAPPTPPPAHPPARHLSPESSSVVSLSGIAYKAAPASGSIGSAGSSSPTDGRQRPLAAVRPYSDTDSGHNSVVSSNYDSHSGSSVGSAGSPPTGKRASVTDDDTTATATATAAATTTTTTITQDNNNTKSSITEAPPTCGSGPPQTRPPLPPYHVVVQNNPAYRQYVRQHYPASSGRQPSLSVSSSASVTHHRPPLPDYLAATGQTARCRQRPTHHARSRSFEGGYYGNDDQLANDFDGEEQVSAV